MEEILEIWSRREPYLPDYMFLTDIVPKTTIDENGCIYFYINKTN